MKNVAIFGLAKSGTTGLFFRIYQSWPEEQSPNLLFEPSSGYEQQNSFIHGRPILSKALIGPKGYCDYSSFGNFDKKILVTRDPRDRIISQVLYNMRHLPTHVDERLAQEFIDLVSTKEKCPDTVSLWSIILFQRRIWYSIPEKEISTTEVSAKSFIKSGFSWQKSFLNCLGTEVLFCEYENVLFNQTEMLNEFLGFPLARDFQVPNEFDIVKRTAAKGGWRNWFNSEDVRIFKPLLNEELKMFGYDFSDWKIANPQKLDPEFGSKYVKRLLVPGNKC